MIATLIIQELRSFFNTPFYWTLTTKAAKEYISCRYLFQLTASRRGWPDCKCSWFQRRNFNSQPHEEADCKSQWMLSVSAYFNSQPHEEADMLVTLRLIVISISTHSLTKRLTQIRQLMLHFNSQPHEEADLSLAVSKVWFIHFNSQPHEEADAVPDISESSRHTISTHSLTKRLTYSRL